jgi:uncharacterized membrane protein HdeD (DUF308 family)
VNRWFYRVVLQRRWLTFVVMGVAFLGFGVGTLNLIYVAQANLRLLFDYGWLALMDGGGRQLFELLLTGYLSMAAYLVFKACEYRLVHWLSDAPAPAPPAPALSQEPIDEDRPAAG